MKLAITIAAALLAGTAFANGDSNGPGQGDGSCVGNCPDNGGGAPSSATATLEANLAALGFSRADARAMADSAANAKATARSGDVTGINANTATGGAAKAAGGNAAAVQSQTQGSVTGRQSARTGDVSSTVIVEGDDNDYPAASAIAPNVVIGDSNECYWTFAIAGAAQGTGGGGSAGAGLFPTRLPTCMKFMLADRYASGYADNPDALRLLREIEESLK